MEDFFLPFLVFLLFGLMLFGLHYVISKRWPEINLGLIAFGAGILVVATVYLNEYSFSFPMRFAIYSFCNIFVGWLLTWPVLVRFIRNLLGGLSQGIGKGWTGSERPKFVILSPGIGEPLKNAPVEIRGKQAAYGFLSSFIASVVLFAVTLINIMIWISGSDQGDRWGTFLLLFFIGSLFVAYSSFLGWLGSKIGRGLATRKVP